MADSRRSPAAAALGALAGASAWISWGALALTSGESGARVGVLPPVWLLPVAAAAGAAAALAVRLPASRAWPLALTAALWLPWLPVRVPTAFLAWDGLLEALIWLAALGGVAGAWWVERGAPAPRFDARRDAVAAAVMAAIGYAGAGLALQDRLPGGDEPHYLIITQSLLADGDLQIENNHARGDYDAYFAGTLKPDFLRRGTNGQIYSIHAPGISVLVLPAFALVGYLGALVTVALLVGAGTGVAWHAAWLLTGDRGAAWVGWAGVACSAPVFFHGFTIYPDGAAAALTMVGVLALVRMSVASVTVSRGTLALAGAALAALPWLHTRAALISGVVGLALALRLWPGPDRRARLAALAAVPVPAALAWFGSFLWIYGTPNPSAPYGGYTQTALAHVLPGLLGLGADQQFGLVANAPVYAVALAGTALLARRHPRLAVELVVMAGVYAVAVASYRMWWGGYSAPARFLVSVLLPAALPIAVAWQVASRALRAGIVLLIGVGGALVLGRVLVDDGKLLYNARDGYDLLLDRASRSLNLPLAFPSLHRGDVSQAAMDIAGWVAVFALAGVALAVAGRRPLSAGRAWTVAVAVAIVAGHAAGYLTWTGSQRPMGTPATSALALLHTWNPTRQPTVVRLTPTRRATADDVPQLVELATSTRGAPPSGDGPLLSVPFVPAGEYQVVATGSQRLEGTLTVTAGRTVEALERWTLDGRGAGYTGLTLDLPVLVHSITITGDEAARRTIRRLTLRPTRIIPPAGRFSTGYAVRAVRLGALRVFALDEKSFLEAGGLWTSGTHTTRLVLAHDPGAAASLSLRIGPVPAVVTARSGAWEQRWERLPGERWDVRLPEAGADGLLLELRAEPAFRPADHEPGSTDRRWLGVRLEVPRAPSLEPARVRTVPPRRSTSP